MKYNGGIDIMKYKVGDKVRIKSLDWYNKNKDELDQVKCSYYIFTHPMTKYCGKTVTIKCINTKDCYYLISEDDGYRSWTDEMIECKVEEDKLMDLVEHCSLKLEVILPDGYIFKDENGNVINANKIILEKKKKEYPKTYEECCKVLGYSGNYNMILTTDVDNKLFNALYRLKVCRDAYWKIAGEEMGLGKPWEPDWKNSEEKRYCIVNIEGVIILSDKVLTKWILNVTNKILVFPTEKNARCFL